MRDLTKLIQIIFVIIMLYDKYEVLCNCFNRWSREWNLSYHARGTPSEYVEHVFGKLSNPPF